MVVNCLFDDTSLVYLKMTLLLNSELHVFDDVSVADGCGNAVLLISFPEPDQQHSETQCVWNCT